MDQDRQQTRGASASLRALRRAAEPLGDWARAETPDRVHLYILSAAHKMGRFEPFTDEEAALNAWLLEQMAGRKLCDYAWRMISHSA